MAMDPAQGQQDAMTLNKPKANHPESFSPGRATDKTTIDGVVEAEGPHNSAEALVERLEVLSVSPDTTCERVTTPTPADRANWAHHSPAAGLPPPPVRMSPMLCYSPQMIGEDPHAAFDLTPVTRNTSGNDVVEASTELTNCPIVSPEEGVLHGEHLALPSDLELSSPNAAATHLQQQLPPMKVHRARSVGTLDGSVLRTASLLLKQEEALLHHQQQQQQDPPSVDFHRQANSFTSREEYEKEYALWLAQQQPTPHRLVPYQPKRQDWMDVGASVPEEELNQIFISRPEGAFQDPIPLEERQWSIPSIRWANHVNGGSTTSNEEDDLYCKDDDGSLSSRCSSLYLPEDLGEATCQQPIAEQQHPPLLQVQVQDTNTDEHAHRCLRRKRSKKEERAMTWLRTIQASGQDEFAEAASSKFLTRSSSESPPLVASRSLSFTAIQRQTSLPLEPETNTDSKTVAPAAMQV